MPDIFPGVNFVPGVYSRVQPGGPQGLGTQRHIALIMGIRLASATVAALTPVQVTSAEQGATYHGEGSQLAAMVRAFKNNNPLVEVWTVGIAEEAGGTAATGTLTFSGTATEAGTINLLIAGVRVAVGVASGDTAATIATNAEAAIDAVTRLPVTAGVAGAVVTCTCRWKGASGNAIDLRHSYYAGEKLPAGVSLAIVAMASGATDPGLDDIIAVLDSDTQYDTWVVPFSDTANLTFVEDELADRGGPLRGIPGQAFVGLRGTFSATQTLGDGRNSEHMSILGLSALPTPPWEAAAAVAAIDAGFTDLNAPRRGTVVRGVLPPAEGARFDFSERNLLLQDGVSTFSVDSGRYVIERLITTRQETDGAEDRNYLDIGTPRVLNYLRRDLRDWATLFYKGAKLVGDEDEVGPGVKVARPKTIKADIIQRMKLHERKAYLANIASTTETMVVELDATPGRANASGTVYVVQGFQQLAIDLTFLAFTAS